jgi:hypothetical protein
MAIRKPYHSSSSSRDDGIQVQGNKDADAVDGVMTMLDEILNEQHHRL